MSEMKTCPTCGQHITIGSAPTDVRAIWPACQAAARSHGKKWTALSTNRLALLTTRLRENPNEPPEILVHAIHGAFTYFSTFRSETFSPLANLVPETIYRRSHFQKYLEHYQPEGPPKRVVLPPAVRAPETRATPEQRARGAALLDGLVGKFGRRMPS